MSGEAPKEAGCPTPRRRRPRRGGEPGGWRGGQPEVPGVRRGGLRRLRFTRHVRRARRQRRPAPLPGLRLSLQPCRLPVQGQGHGECPAEAVLLRRPHRGQLFFLLYYHLFLVLIYFPMF